MNEYAERIAVERYPLWRDRAPRLVALDLELTERCNNDCIHCCINRPVEDREARARELSTAEVENILGEAAGLGCLTVRFTGGEPLLRADFEELYLCARRLGMKVLLFTNARLITPRLAELFANVPPLVPIEVSVYGMRAESYEAVSRVPGSFAQFRRGVDLLEEQGVPFIVKSALLPPNKDEIEEFEAWAATLPWMHKPPGCAMFFDLRHRRDDPEKNRRIESLRVSCDKDLELLTRNDGDYVRERAEFRGKFMGPAGDRLFSCGAGTGGCVDAYGRFQPCLSLRAPEWSYDLRRGTLQDGLLNFFPRLKEIRATNPEYLARCAKCSLKGLCEQCPAKSWAESGTFDTPVEYLCQIAHAQARYLGLLESEQKGWT
jgi:radical SAM protein with 4Fe4S-binding SPASM domain